MTNDELARLMREGFDRLNERIDALGQTMMRQFEYVIREIRRVEEGVPRSDSRDREYPCPINGCGQVFMGGRAGWDSHVAAHGKHPDWLPRTVDGDERKRAFRERFAYWFDDERTRGGDPGVEQFPCRQSGSRAPRARLTHYRLVQGVTGADGCVARHNANGRSS